MQLRLDGSGNAELVLSGDDARPYSAANGTWKFDAFVTTTALSDSELQKFGDFLAWDLDR